MENIKFYVCNDCQEFAVASNQMEVACCKKLSPLEIHTEENEKHTPQIKVTEEELTVTIPHGMSEEHFIMFIAYVHEETVEVIKLKHNETPIVHFKNHHTGTIYSYCNIHGLWKKNIF